MIGAESIDATHSVVVSHRRNRLEWFLPAIAMLGFSIGLESPDAPDHAFRQSQA